MGYWGKVAKRAFVEARAEVRLDKPVRIVTSIITPIVAGVVVWHFTGNMAWAGIVTAGLLLLVGLCVFLERMVSVPGAMASEQDAAIASLRTEISNDETAERRSQIWTLANLYVNEFKPADADAISYGLMNPPEDWVNDKLARYEFNWRVRFSPGAKMEFYDLG